MPYKQFFVAQKTTANSDSYQWLGGSGIATANSYGAGVVRLEHSPASSTGPFVLGSTSYVLSAATSYDSFKFEFPAGVWIRGAVTTASSTGLNLWIH